MNGAKSRLTTDIEEGLLDEELDEVERAIKQRRKMLEQDALEKVKPGDTVWIGSSVSPKYLSGLPAEVVRVVDDKHIEIKLDTFDRERLWRSGRRFGSYGQFKCPKSLLRVGP